jgi:hypothetical protein
MAASKELAARRAKLLETLRLRGRQRDLEFDHETGSVRTLEGQAKVRLEQHLGRRIENSTELGVDVVDPQGHGPIQIKGPIPAKGNVDGLADAAVKDLTMKSATKTLAVDVTGLSPSDAARVSARVEAAAQATGKRVIIIGTPSRQAEKPGASPAPSSPNADAPPAHETAVPSMTKSAPGPEETAASIAPKTAPAAVSTATADKAASGVPADTEATAKTAASASPDATTTAAPKIAPGAPLPGVGPETATAPNPAQPGPAGVETTPTAAKRPTPSAAKRLADAGESINTRAAGKHQDAIIAEQQYGEKVADAKTRVAEAQAAILERQQAGGKPTKAQLNEQAVALRQLTEASRKQESARESVRTSEATAKEKAAEAAERKQAYQELLDQKAAEKAGKTTAAGPRAEVQAAWSSSAKKAIWKAFGAKEIADRLAGRSSAPQPAASKTAAASESQPASNSEFAGKPSDWDPATAPAGFVEVRKGAAWDGIDPIKALTDPELAHVAATGELPERLTIENGAAKLGPELEHRIPQRVAGLLAEAGVPTDIAINAAKLTDPSNLEPLFAETHAVFDEHRNTGEARATLDDRRSRPLSRATDAELADIAAALKQAKNPQSQAAQELRDALKAERAARSTGSWEVP